MRVTDADARSARTALAHRDLALRSVACILRANVRAPLETGVRDALMPALKGTGLLRAAPPLPDWNARPYRVLFIRNDRIGDMVVSLEVMRAIAESSPNITLDVLAAPANAPLARGLPWISEVLISERGVMKFARLCRELARRRYDVAIDGRVFVAAVSVRRRLVLRCTRAPWRIGWSGSRHDGIYNLPIPPSDLPHWIDYLVALAAPFGVRPDSRDWRPRLRVSPSVRADAEQRWRAGVGDRPRVLVNVSAGHPNRRWPDDRWSAVLQRVRQHLPDASIAVSAMPGERESAERLAGAVNGMAFTLGLEDTIAAVATADFVITPDTAISHVASAFERLTLTLLPRGFERLVPYRTPGRNVFSDDPLRLDGLPASRALAELDQLVRDNAAILSPSAVRS